jgi:hypothetical protein
MFMRPPRLKEFRFAGHYTKVLYVVEIASIATREARSVLAFIYPPVFVHKDAGIKLVRS